MRYYVTTDPAGCITVCSPWPFPGTSLCQCEVVSCPNGKFYRSDALPWIYVISGSVGQYVGECPMGGAMMSGSRLEDIRDVSGAVTETWVASQQGS